MYIALRECNRERLLVLLCMWKSSCEGEQGKEVEKQQHAEMYACGTVSAWYGQLGGRRKVDVEASSSNVSAILYEGAVRTPCMRHIGLWRKR